MKSTTGLSMKSTTGPSMAVLAEVRALAVSRRSDRVEQELLPDVRPLR
jgi:hypothetical protein